MYDKLLSSVVNNFICSEIYSAQILFYFIRLALINALLSEIHFGVNVSRCFECSRQGSFDYDGVGGKNRVKTLIDVEIIDNKTKTIESLTFSVLFYSDIFFSNLYSTVLF